MPDLSRHADRSTSVEAGVGVASREGDEEVKPGTHRHRVLLSYYEHGECTDNEAAFYAILREGEGRLESLRRRSSDLLAFGLIADTGVRRRSKMDIGGVRFEHCITDEGIRAIGLLGRGKVWTR